MGKKKKDDIVISFIGNSKDNVTGSCVSISYPKKNNEHGLIILECGLVQGDSTIEKTYNSNKAMLDRIGKEVVSSCEWLILGHSHI